jgi:hypothetical protein
MAILRRATLTPSKIELLVAHVSTFASVADGSAADAPTVLAYVRQ